MSAVDTNEMRAAFEDVFDQALVFHTFTDYMRDYDVFVYATADPRTGIQPEHLRYRFTHCVRADIRTAVSEETWARSLDERLTSYDTGVDLDGYVWGVAWQVLYPGFSLVEESSEAAHWSAALGIPFHHVEVRTNGHNFDLIFSDLRVDKVGPGVSPFAVPESGPDFKVPLA